MDSDHLLSWVSLGAFYVIQYVISTKLKKATYHVINHSYLEIPTRATVMASVLDFIALKGSRA